MCGIIGYLGKEEAIPILIDGLKTLEYRGYDSAGFAVVGKSNFVIEKSVGKVALLEEKAAKFKKNGFNTGIAHTRWATHGKVTELNTHPHSDCSNNIHIVHNGIIENYKELKEKLIKDNHKFVSETDTEVVAHLIEKAMKDGGIQLEDAVRLALKEIRGTYGLIAVDTRNPDKLIAARNFSPLILGIGKNEFIIASDAAPILKFTKDVVYIQDGEIIEITSGGYRISTIDNDTINRTPQYLDWDTSTAQKDTFSHFMIKEISEEPDAVRNSLRGRLSVEDGEAVLGGLKGAEKNIGRIKRLHIAACGTAYLAGKVGEYMLEEYAGVPVKVDFASEVRYRKPIFNENDIFLAISQSGETADTLASLYEAKEKNILTLGIVNVVGSTISRETDAGIYQHVGPEISVASTKTFVSQVAIMALLTIYIGRKKDMSMVMGRRISSELLKIPELMEKVLSQAQIIKKFAKVYSSYDNFFYIGRKYNYPIALEGALKIKEVAYVHAEGYASGELKHGPIALIDKGFPSIVIAPQDSVYEKTLSGIEEIKARGGKVFAIATEGDGEIAKLADSVFYIPKTLEMLTPLLSIIPLHLFAYYVAVARGCDVDKPRNLAKSVTVE